MPTPPPLRPSREFPRAKASFSVQVKVGRAYVAVPARDVSMTGMYLEEPVAVPDLVPMRIPLPGEQREVETTCRVERREPDGVALSFAQIDWEDLLAVARYLSPRI